MDHHGWDDANDGYIIVSLIHHLARILMFDVDQLIHNNSQLYLYNEYKRLILYYNGIIKICLIVRDLCFLYASEHLKTEFNDHFMYSNKGILLNSLL